MIFEQNYPAERKEAHRVPRAEAYTMNRREYGYGQSPSALPRHIRGGISLAYGLWLLVQWPLLAHVYGLTTQFEIYSVSLAAPLLSWYAAQKYCLNMVSAPQMFRPWLSIASALLMIVAARAPFGTSMNVLLSCGGFILLRMSLSAESLGQVMMAGGAVMLFVIPIPASVVDRLIWALQHMHASLIMRLFEPISGIHLTRYGLCLATPWGNYLGLQPECSGIRSLLGMMMLASYYATAQRHRWAGLILTCVTTAWLAVSLNFIRIIISFSFKIAGNSYWGTSGGHELMGLIIIIFGMWMIRFLARHMYETDLVLPGRGNPCSA
jgi:exosortase/archaeosortase family protein